MAASLYEFASQSDGLGFRGVLVRENASLTEELTAELAGILSWVVGRVGPADPSGEGTEPKSSTETILALQDSSPLLLRSYATAADRHWSRDPDCGPFRRLAFVMRGQRTQAGVGPDLRT